MTDLSKEELLAIIAKQQEELKRKDDEYSRKLKVNIKIHFDPYFQLT